MSDLNGEQVLTIPEAADKLGLPLDKIRRRVRQNRFKLRESGALVKIGPLDFVRADHLDEIAALVGETSKLRSNLRRGTWGKEIPAQEGYYWFRSSSRKAPEILEVHQNENGFLIVQFESSWAPLSRFDGEWSGPIPLPMEVRRGP